MRFFGISMTNGLVTVPGPVSLPQLSYDAITLGTISDARLSGNVALVDGAQTLTNKTIDTATNNITVDIADVTGLTAALATYTPADVLAKLITVDGAGSGLDADLLDGMSSAAFVSAATYTAADVLAKLLTVDGAGSGLDADLLDGLSSAAFLQTSTYQGLAPTWTLQHTFTAGSGAVVLSNAAGPILRLVNTAAGVDGKNIRIRNLAGNYAISLEDDAGAGAAVNGLLMSRSVTAWTSLTFGNTTDNPTYSFAGTGTATFSGQVTGLRFVPSSSTIPTNGLYLPNANNPGLAANTTKVIDWTSTLVTVTGNLSLGTAGNKVLIKEGSNASMGVATLVAGTVTVNNTLVTASSRIFLSVQSLGTVAVATPVAVTARTAGTSFTITSAAVTDTSVVAWHIIEPAP